MPHRDSTEVIIEILNWTYPKLLKPSLGMLIFYEN